MIPTHILVLLSIFVVMYFISLGLTITILIKAFKDNNRYMISIAMLVLIIEISFGLSLI
jgi:hypothetical protein